MGLNNTERPLNGVCACGCGTAIPTTNVDGEPMRLAPHHMDHAALEKQRLTRDHRRIVRRIRSIPTRPTL